MAYKYKMVYDRLRPEIEAQWRMGKDRIAPESELKVKYSVSVSTIRQAVNQLVAEGFLRKVQGSGCYINGALFSMDRVIELYLLAYGVSEDSPNFRHFLSMTAPPVLENGFHFSLRMIPECTAILDQFNSELRRIKQIPGCDCVLTLAGNYSKEMIDELQKISKPVIFLNEFQTKKLNDMDLNQICGDNRFLASECVRYLEGMGHKSISIVTRSPEIYHIGMFLDGACEGADKAKINPLIIPPHAFKYSELGISPEETRSLIAELCKKSTAVIFYSINTCMFVEELKRHNISIPDELSLLSADDNIPHINCVSSDFSHYLKTIFEVSRRLVTNNSGIEKHRIKIPVEILDRHTVKQINK